MADTRFRYPGAQPFRDDDVARQTFFGRDAAAIALTDQILANRLVVVYAKSGIGKTSLLNAGVAPRLRSANTMPLFLRVNDVEHDIRTSLFEEIRSEAARQKVEYVAGDTSSLWTFFKTAQFWRGDLLLTPVLILDQFEELFTLQGQKQREQFLSELSYLVRGVAPSLPAGIKLTETPPPIYVVLSLREDFLGLLEEASDRIPQILDHRFRLAPLDHDTAAEAITRPAELNNPSFATKPFRLDPDVVPAILDYLSRSTSGGKGASRYIEPFHLQLVCQRMERVMADKQKLGGVLGQFSLKDLGGEEALAETLSNFYADAVGSLQGYFVRRTARRMCEEYLISPEGRRLSVDERELQTQLGLTSQVLRQLVDRRLLRTDRRADATYYELSHDALVQPVLDSRRTQALVVGWVAVIVGTIVSFVTGAFIVLTILAVAGLMGKMEADALLGLVLIAIVAAAVASFSVRWFRAGMRTRRRYRRRPVSGRIQQPAVVTTKHRWLARASLITGLGISSFYSLAGAFMFFCFAVFALKHAHLPGWLSWTHAESDLRIVYDRPVVELFWAFGEIVVIVAFGWLLLRFGIRRLWPHELRLRPRMTAGVEKITPMGRGLVKLFVGAIGISVSLLLSRGLRQCMTTYQGQLPGWIPKRLVASDFSDACSRLYQPGWEFTGFTVALFLFALFVLSARLLCTGVKATRAAIPQARLTTEETGKAATQRSG